MDITLFTGGSGLLGREMQDAFKEKAAFPASSVFDVTNYAGMEDCIGMLKQGGNTVTTLVHMAAFVSPPKVEENPMKALEVNIIGTANVIKLCQKNDIRLIYISTDYVFSGEKGNYSENDSVYPVNKYAWSKLGGECAVKMYDKHVIIRLSFGPNIFPYEGAFIDQWTSRLPVKEIVPKIIRVVNSDFIGTIHLGSKPRTVYEYAKSVSPDKDIKQISIASMKTKVPRDTSLNTTKFDTFVSGGW